METAVTSRKRRYDPETVSDASGSPFKRADLEESNGARQRADRLIMLAVEGLYLEQQAASFNVEDRIENELCV